MRTWIEDNSTIINALAAAIGVLLVIFTGLHLFVVRPLQNQIEMLASTINQRFDAIEKYTDGRFKTVDQHFDAVDERFDAVDQRFDAVDQRFDQTDRRLDRLTDEVSELHKTVTGLGERVSRNEGELDVIREQQQLKTASDP